jgi:hypothetical protein
MTTTTRKPTARMVDALRSAGTDGLIGTWFTARTCEGLVSRGMAERSSVGYKLTDAGRAFLVELGGTEAQQENPAPWAVPGVRARCSAGLGKITDRFVQKSGIETVTFVPDGARAGDALAIDVRDPHLSPVPSTPAEPEEQPEPLDPARFAHMVGTVRTQVRKLHRDDNGQ